LGQWEGKWSGSINYYSAGKDSSKAFKVPAKLEFERVCAGKWLRLEISSKGVPDYAAIAMFGWDASADPGKRASVMWCDQYWAHPWIGYGELSNEGAKLEYEIRGPSILDPSVEAVYSVLLQRDNGKKGRQRRQTAQFELRLEAVEGEGQVIFDAEINR
jgi:hypothetical protein